MYRDETITNLTRSDSRNKITAQLSNKENFLKPGKIKWSAPLLPKRQQLKSSCQAWQLEINSWRCSHFVGWKGNSHSSCSSPGFPLSHPCSLVIQPSPRNNSESCRYSRCGLHFHIQQPQKDIVPGGPRWGSKLDFGHLLFMVLLHSGSYSEQSRGLVGLTGHRNFNCSTHMQRIAQATMGWIGEER